MEFIDRSMASLKARPLQFLLVVAVVVVVVVSVKWLTLLINWLSNGIFFVFLWRFDQNDSENCSCFEHVLWLEYLRMFNYYVQFIQNKYMTRTKTRTNKKRRRRIIWNNWLKMTLKIFLCDHLAIWVFFIFVFIFFNDFASKTKKKTSKIAINESFRRTYWAIKCVHKYLQQLLIMRKMLKTSVNITLSQ